MVFCNCSPFFNIFVLLTVAVEVFQGGLANNDKADNFARDLEEIESLNSHNQQGRCMTNHRRVKRHDHEIFPTSRHKDNSFGSALYFSGSEIIRFNNVRLPPREFTVDFWFQREGGQQNDVAIIGSHDFCTLSNKQSGWKIGLRESEEESKLKLYFSLTSHRSSKRTTIESHDVIKPRTWMRVTATYDGKRMKLYVNQAKVAMGHKQKGFVFGVPSIDCEVFEAGGDQKTGSFFRGTLDEIRLWNVAKSHKEIAEMVAISLNEHALEMYEGFESITNNQNMKWRGVTRNLPRLIKSTIPYNTHDLSLSKPPCGVTICDNPEVIRSYVEHKHLRGHKTVRYRVINVWESDGRNPTVSQAQIDEQHRALNLAFAPHNISWELHQVDLRNSSLRRTTIFYSCKSTMVGDGNCHNECKYAITGNDGGDCDDKPLICDHAKRGNGKCDPECNRHYHAWDHGDCCNPDVTITHKTCFDPKSPFKAYMGLQEYKQVINLENRKYHNVYFAQWGRGGMHGVATFPWDKTVYGALGGTVLKPSNYGHSDHINVAVHEFGHVLGLWHVFHGVSEKNMDCADECFELFPSLELGDLCSDTNPTTDHDLCSDPIITENETEETCGLKHFKNTPFRNYMGYSGNNCTDSFTPQQEARMHCYIDLMYQSWLSHNNDEPSFIPLPPRVISKTKNQVRLAWIPPMGTGDKNAINRCSECREDHVLHQYAVSAYSPNPAKASGNWAPHQAVGSPDAEPCYASSEAWIPITTSCPDCHIELSFKEAVVPSELTIWVVWNASDGITDIVLIHPDGTTTSLGNATAQCDTPLTIRLFVQKLVNKVRIHVAKPYISIDAVRLTSQVNHPNCLNCKPLTYLVQREPPFSIGSRKSVDSTLFSDKEVKPDQTYVYNILPVSSTGAIGPPSLPLYFKSKDGFCGDGVVDEKSGEECDDGNVRDGDGCNVRCKKEDVFHCTGQPSLCYRHDGDGICEDFEIKSSIKDCGFYTPEGFHDQWATKARDNPRYHKKSNSVDVLLGPPPRDLVCKQEADRKIAWYPYRFRRQGNYWIELMFNEPVVASAVVVYLGSDGTIENNAEQKALKIQLDDHSEFHHATISCKVNPVIIPIHHNMLQPFFYTNKVTVHFSFTHIAIAAVALRSKTLFDPVALSSCKHDELFNPRTQLCHKYSCNFPKCSELSVQNAVLKCSGNADGDKCEVQCSYGFLPTKSFKITCVDGKWKGKISECKPVECGIPKVPNADVECLKGTSFGKKCHYKCQPLAKLRGTDTTITCEGDSMWSVQQAMCVRTCQEPLPPPFTLPSTTPCGGVKGKPNYPGSTCKFRCIHGYHDNSDPEKKTVKLKCTKQGKWVGTRCMPISCKLPPKSIFRWYNCTYGHHFGSTCSFSCPAQPEHIVKCNGDGEWNSPFKVCKYDGKCAPPKAPPGIELKCDGLEPMSSCTPKCTARGQDVVLQGKEDVHKVSIVCSNRLTWQSNPEQLICVPGCEKMFISDGWCDRQTNNKHCWWDGGDCCDSTTADGKVKTFPATCTEGCECNDPNARENQYPENEGEDTDDEDYELPNNNSGVSGEGFSDNNRENWHSMTEAEVEQVTFVLCLVVNSTLG